MKSFNLEHFYNQFDKQIRLVGTVSDKKELETVITMCRLKPYDCILGNYTENIILHNHWIDEYGNSLFLDKKKIKIIPFNLKLDRSRLVNTDMYRDIDISKVSMITRFAYILYGRDEDLQDDHIVLAMWGVDGYLRVFSLIYGEWTRVPPLLLGEKVLFEIINNNDLHLYKEIKARGTVLYPCESQKAWLTSWPAQEGFFSELSKEHDQLVKLLKQTGVY